MTLRSMDHIVVPSLALVGACSAAVLFGIVHLRREPSIETRAATTAAPTVASSARRDGGSPALATARAEANAAIPTVSPRSQDTNDFVPSFDIARIERTGEAVIAGRAAPNAIVELLRNGERHDRGVADPSGQFIMVPPRLPSGKYELTLRSRQPDGEQATSKRSVAVALDDVEFSSDVLNSRAEMPWEGARFAAMSLTKDQGMRAIISNVLVPANGTHLAPCQVQVSFFSADGSLIGDPTTVKLKAGESTSVPAAHPSKLARAIVSIGDVVDPAKVCALRTSVEIFDLQTDTTFVSVPGESIGSNSEYGVSATPVLGAARKNAAGRKNSAPVTTFSSLSEGAVSPNTKSPELAATPPTAPR
jgi:hypothetical protein